MAYKNLYLDIHTKSGHRTIHAGIIADRIVRKFPDIRKTPEYATLEDRYFDYTQACDREEQRGWMGHYMYEALRKEAEATRLKSRGSSHWAAANGMIRDAALQFIVAYDMICD